MTSYRGVEAIDWFGDSQLWSQTVGYAITTSRIDSLNRKKTLSRSLASAGLLFFEKEDLAGFQYLKDVSLPKFNPRKMVDMILKPVTVKIRVTGFLCKRGVHPKSGNIEAGLVDYACESV